MAEKISGMTSTTLTPLDVDLDAVEFEINNAFVTEKITRKLIRGNYKSYVALISQSGKVDPTIDAILENTLGNIVWTRNNEGEYIGTLSNAFTTNKVICFAGVNNNTLSSIQLSASTVNEIALNTFDSTNTLSDALLSNTSIEIRVYE
jgi:hypothetical protein